MAHILAVESWVMGTGRLLPAAITRLGHRCTFVTRQVAHYHDERTREIHPWFEHADHVLTAETNDVGALVEFLRRQHEILGFDGVVTTCDYYIDTVAEVARALGLPHAFSSNVAIERRKHRVREAIERTGLPNPIFRVATDWEQARRAAREIGFPLILKPSDLSSSAFVRLVKNEGELREAFTRLEAFTTNVRGQAREPLWLLEEFMTGEEVSVEAVTYRGRTTVLGITDKSLSGFPFFIEDGHMFPAALEPATADAVAQLVVGALEAVGHDHGTSHTEVKITPKGPRIVEINPRPAGNFIPELIQHVTGIDLLEAQVELALGRCPRLERQHTGTESAAVAFLIPGRAGRLADVRGLESLGRDPNVVRWRVSASAGAEVAEPVDNSCYLGHVVVVDREGRRARRFAEQALGRVELRFAETPAAVALP